jgi:lactate racemase
MSIVSVPQCAWYNPRPLDLTLPDSWKVEVCHMAGYDRKALKPAGIKAALDKPIGTPTIRELAKGKKEVVIIFDDQTRITRPAPIVPFILEELAEAGVKDKNIRFICGLGLHGAMTRTDFISKLGADIVAKYRCYNHHPFDKGTFVGTTELYKTPVYVNEEVMLCDLKIAITGCVPHPGAGFGGGGKIVLPGITSRETTAWNHSQHISPSKDQASANPTMGHIENNKMREDIDQAADLARIDFGICVVVNEWGESVSLYAGTLRTSHAAAVKDARDNYKTAPVTGMDVVIANTYGKVNEMIIGLGVAVPAVSKKGGDVVLIANAPGGQITHYGSGPFGNIIWGRKASLGCPANVQRIIVFTEYPHPGSSWLAENEMVLYLHQWDDVIKLLQKTHKAGTKVAVYPDATNQYIGK